ncbi:GntR family transcriptional regulator [Streptomyces carminius]|uniref:GntR family transcriptional regulator n=1 Tax=Streptomyces carminius TaxID=2665496 RepID=A0A2M8LUB8_9ACTN|nr:winged helix-turn-helix domain-containing protein [Streptomyces carminius]PJE95552.1 GntR family transcriptional regulator [Streptomyces carminius]
MTELDETRAKWIQVRDILAARIEDGAYPPNSRVPSVVALTEEFGVAVATAQKALRGLREAGLTRTEPGLGSFVIGPNGKSS